MKIAIIGLGLIGGSFAKALSRYREQHHTDDLLLGTDLDPAVVQRARKEKSIDAVFSGSENVDLLLLALPPEASIRYLQEWVQEIPETCTVLDVGGTKRRICECVKKIPGRRFSFYGCHPMAGRETSGYDASLPRLFFQASLIVTRCEGLGQNEHSFSRITALAKRAGFARMIVCTPEEHDRVIAYTSQLCHLVSGAYAMSPTQRERSGMTAGSFRDLSRVAYLDPALWTELFTENRDFLVSELDWMIARLTEVRDAIQKEDRSEIFAWLKQSRSAAKEIREQEGLSDSVRILSLQEDFL